MCVSTRFGLLTIETSIENPDFIFCQIYAPQANILDIWTNRCVCVFEALFNSASTSFWLPLIENSFKNAHTTRRLTIENPSFGDHNLCSPNEDLGPSKNMWVRAFVSTFHTPKYSIWAKNDKICLQNVFPTYFSTVPNLRLGSIKFRRFWKAEQTFRTVLSKHFSIFIRQNWVLTYVKSALKMRSRMFARPSQIFVWGA
jgi:hypothetical protein